MKYVIELPEDLKRMIMDEGRFKVARAYRLAACVRAGVALPEHHVDRVEMPVVASLVPEQEQCKDHFKTLHEVFGENLTKKEFSEKFKHMSLIEIEKLMWETYKEER